jgi:SNF2 family DNA or RNA helicase
MQNKHPGNCETCRTRVPAGQGELRKVAGRWIVLCAAHGTAPAVTAAQAVLSLVIRVWLAAGRVLCAPVSRLNGSFDRYLAATRSAGYIFRQEHNAQIGALDQAPALLDALRAAGFTPDVSPELLGMLQTREAQAVNEVQAAGVRTAEVDARLRERGLSLFQFQANGVEWLAPRRKAVLGDDMGLGKTIQALTAVAANTPIVVVCPAVAKGVWVREISRFRPDLTPVALTGRGTFRWAQPGEVVIVNYDILPGEKAAKKGFPATLPANLATAPTGTVLIADEAHALKASDTLRTSQFRALREATLTANGRVWLLTATPILNRPTELWALLQAMNAGFGCDCNGCEWFRAEHGS